MRLNYPIRYAVRPMIEQVGWSHGLNELERRYDAVAYIASKCYVVEKKEEYLESGEKNIEYSVVFPFKQDSDGDYLRQEPEFNLMHGGCINNHFVCKVFMTRQEAMEEAQKMNTEIVRRKIAALTYNADFKENVANIREEQEEKLEYYKFLEEMTEIRTSDLVVEAPIKEQKVIVVDKGKMELRNESLYDIIRYRSRDNFRAFNIGNLEYERMKKAIASDSFFDIEKVDRKLLLEGVPDAELVKINDYDSMKDKGCFYIQNGYMSYDDSLSRAANADEDGNVVRFYTTETYEDVIDSYIPKFLYNCPPFSEEDDVLNKKLIKKERNR